MDFFKSHLTLLHRDNTFNQTITWSDLLQVNKKIIPIQKNLSFAFHCITKIYLMIIFSFPFLLIDYMAII